jgi:hypothetical protein
MTTFDERERAYEAKFARDEELRFKAKARRDKMLGAWAAAALGLTGASAEDYASEVARAEFKHPGESGVLQKLLGDFKAHGVAMDERTLRKKLIDLMAEAVSQVEGVR